MVVKQFRNTEMTNQGFTVSNRASLGKTKFQMTKAVSTDVDLSNYKTQDLKNLTSLPGEQDTATLVDYDMKGDNVSAIKIDFNNENFKDGYTIRAVGIYAKENGSNVEFLHSITVSDSPVNIPAVSGNVFDGFYLTVAIFSGSNKNISVKISDETNATVKYVDEMIANLNVDEIHNSIKENADKIKSLEDDTIKFQGWLKDGDDLNSLPRISGIWGINGLDCTKLNGYPAELKVFNDWNAWGYVKQTGSEWIKQEICNVTTNNDNLIAYRIFENSWHNWEIMATKTMVDNAKEEAENDAKKSLFVETSGIKNDMANGFNDFRSKLSNSTNDLQNQINSKADLKEFVDLENKSFKYHQTLEDGFDLNSMVDFPDGLYDCLNKNVKNAPVSGSWFIIKLYTRAGITVMEFVNNWGNRFFRVASGSPKGWSSWEQLPTTNDLNTAINARVDWDTYNNKIGDLQNQINNKVNSADYVSKTTDLQNQINGNSNNLQNGINARVDWGTYNNKVDDFQKQIWERVSNSTFNDNNNNFQNKINDINNNTLKYRGTLQDGDDLNDLINAPDGYLDCFNSNVKNQPVDQTKWFVVMITNRAGITYMEYIDHSSDRFYRVASGFPKAWGDWHHIANFLDIDNKVNDAKNELNGNINNRVDWNSYNGKVNDFQNQINDRIENEIFYPKVNDLQNQINNLQNQLNNSLQFKGEAPNPLSNATAPGIYLMPGNVNYSDAPDNTNRGQMFVLETGGLTNQMILDNHGNILNRSIGGNGTTKWK